MPELVPVLREDVQHALAETNGVFTSSAMQNMKKVDSFLKETMRYHSMGPSASIPPDFATRGIAKG